MNERSFVHGV